MLRNPQSFFPAFGQSLGDGVRPTVDEERRVKSLIKEFGLDENLIRTKRQDWFDDRYLTFLALRTVYPQCPIELTVEQIYPRQERSLKSLEFLLHGYWRSAEYRGYVLLRRSHWKAYPSLRGKPLGMIFTPMKRHIFVMHDSPDLCREDDLRLTSCDRAPGLHAAIYVQTWKTFVKMLKKVWQLKLTVELEPWFQHPLVDDPVSQIKGQLLLRGLRQKDLAEALGVSEVFVSNSHRWPILCRRLRERESGGSFDGRVSDSETHAAQTRARPVRMSSAMRAASGCGRSPGFRSRSGRCPRRRRDRGGGRTRSLMEMPRNSPRSAPKRSPTAIWLSCTWHPRPAGPRRASTWYGPNCAPARTRWEC